MPKLETANLQEAINLSPFYSGAVGVDRTLDPDSHLYRPIFPTRPSATQLPSTIQSHMQEVCLYYYQANPLAHRYIDMVKDYTVGEGVTFKAADKQVQALLEEFWYGIDNDVANSLPQWVVELSIYGEVALAFQPRKGDPCLKLQYINPSWISEVAVDPFDVSRVTSIKLDPNQIKISRRIGGKDIDDPVFPLIARDKDKLLNGQAIFLRINHVSDSPRGIGDLFPLADSMANIDELMFNVKERSRHLTQYFWNVTIEGGTDETCRTKLQEYLQQPLYPGTIRVHNERIKWEQMKVDLGGADIEKVLAPMIGLVITGLGIPAYWTGMSGAPARAAAESVQDPVYKRLITRQGVIKRFLQTLLAFQMDYAIRQKYLPKTIDKTVKILMPKIAIRDLQRTGGAVNRIASSLLEMLEGGVYTKEEVRKMLEELLAELGMTAPTGGQT